jgi:hypothetical protein
LINQCVSIDSEQVAVLKVAICFCLLLKNNKNMSCQTKCKKLDRYSGTGTNFEPFEAAFVNTYLLQAGRVGGQATYEMYYQYQEMSARMFGGFVNFEFNPVTRTVTLLRKFNDSGEKVVLWVYNTRPESGLLQDKQIQPWIQDYSLALAKFTLGEARSKFSTIAGPQGGTSLNGDTLKAEAQAEMMQLEEDLKNYIDGSDPLSFIIG